MDEEDREEIETKVERLEEQLVQEELSVQEVEVEVEVEVEEVEEEAPVEVDMLLLKAQLLPSHENIS